MPGTFKHGQRLITARRIVTKCRTDQHDPKLWNAAARKLAGGTKSVWLGDDSLFPDLPPEVIVALKRCDREAEEAGLLTW